ncbi:GNAT family N-acetyltransferase [Pseudonocardia asaccharolytica]|uniref:N-acetyltransferase n=1 Tax=Pseudonocardia asaccharolytica DSM 44247 = NBRC 16224 TaxID=1123024 RepID=A0A511D056_9PSEU|nr:GNAT family N-acetyltransferase [Pseudonocardia asaccharolytica]GEL16248.1 N-acetyltransferase [Pseudonocardia asaccharolytica DSM 44247 = NBRC 16224]
MAAHVVEIRRHDYLDPVVQQLIGEVQDEYVVRYGDADRSPVDPAEFTPPRGAVLLAWCDDDAVASVALRAVPDTPATAEVKRLYVRRHHRRRGLGRTLLRAAEDRARAMGYRRVILETGTRQPESLRLYASEGYHRIPGYGYYAHQPQTVCFGKDLR